MEVLEAVQASIDPSWTRIGRIFAIDNPDKSDSMKRKKGIQPDTEYLVKWEGLPYQDCSWEKAADLLEHEEFALALEKFENYTPIINEPCHPRYKKVRVLPALQFFLLHPAETRKKGCNAPFNHPVYI